MHKTHTGESGKLLTFTDDIDHLSHEELINLYYDLHMAYTELTDSFKNRDLVITSFLKRQNEAYYGKIINSHTAPQTILCLKMLMTGKLCSKEAILYNISSNEDASLKLAQVTVCRVRAVLKPLGIKVITQYSRGYYISKTDIKKFKDLVNAYEKETF